MPDTVHGHDHKQAWVERVLNVRLAPMPGQAEPLPPQTHVPEMPELPTHETGHDPTELRGRLNETGIRLRDLAHNEGFQALSERFAEAVQALKSNDWDEVVDALDEVEEAMAGQLSGARGEAAGRVIRAANAWRQACAVIEQQLPAFRSAMVSMLEDSDEYEPDELAEVEERINASLEPILAQMSEDLSDTATQAINADGDRSNQALADMLRRIEGLEGYFTGNETIRLIDANGISPTSIASTASTALAALREALASA
jgi:hypothetical protein